MFIITVHNYNLIDPDYTGYYISDPTAVYNA